MNVCVFTGSSIGTHPNYRQAAQSLGYYLAEHDHDLVYGGASVGLMGAVADAILEAGGKAYGVLPTTLQRREIIHEDLTELMIVPDMHTRKAKMAELSDIFIVMPGGIGTMEEMFEIWTWSQLGIHRKPIGLLNIDNYYQQLLTFMDHTVKQGFLKPQHRQLMACENTPKSLIQKMTELETSNQ